MQLGINGYSAQSNSPRFTQLISLSPKAKNLIENGANVSPYIALVPNTA
jgi:hypothetical protein